MAQRRKQKAAFMKHSRLNFTTVAQTFVKPAPSVRRWHSIECKATELVEWAELED